jgi:hypothetical protein
METGMYEMIDGGKSSFTRYTKEELRKAWNSGGQGNQHARDSLRSPHEFTVIVPCVSESDALILTALFVRKVFAIPSCCSYEPETKRLALYCGDSGRGWMETKRAAISMVQNWILTRYVDQCGPLFASK